jgi:hypothetical protein
MQNQGVVGKNPLVLRQEPLEVFFHLVRVFVLAKNQPSSQSAHMGIHGNGRATKGIGQNHIGRFSPYTGQTGNRFKIVGNFPVKPFNQSPGCSNDVFGLAAVEANFFDQGHDFFGRCQRQRKSIRIAPKKG